MHMLIRRKMKSKTKMEILRMSSKKPPPVRLVLRKRTTIALWRKGNRLLQMRRMGNSKWKNVKFRASFLDVNLHGHVDRYTSNPVKYFTPASNKARASQPLLWVGRSETEECAAGEAMEA
mmetsp:Transcript_2264/g.6869  ORF Transcript_2264/g.6869 Transcript_2264/m.6869 type:complete len:120 (-) Transcript_2264:2905-3264(-)